MPSGDYVERTGAVTLSVLSRGLLISLSVQVRQGRQAAVPVFTWGGGGRLRLTSLDVKTAELSAGTEPRYLTNMAAFIQGCRADSELDLLLPFGTN